MSSVLRKNLQTLQFIANLKNNNLRKLLLKEFGKSNDFYKAVKEIVENTLKKNIPVNQSERKRLKRHKSVLVNFLKPKKNKRDKQKLLQQSGGFLPILIPLVLSLLNK